MESPSNRFSPFLQNRKPSAIGRREGVRAYGGLKKTVDTKTTGRKSICAVWTGMRQQIIRRWLRPTRVRAPTLMDVCECSASVGMKAFFDMMDKDPHKVMILGGSCNSVTDSIAKTSKHWRIPVLSYADTHPMFTRKSYPNFFRIVPSENAFNAPRVKLLQAFNWTRVGTLYQNEPRFALCRVLSRVMSHDRDGWPVYLVLFPLEMGSPLLTQLMDEKSFCPPLSSALGYDNADGYKLANIINISIQSTTVATIITTRLCRPRARKLDAISSYMSGLGWEGGGQSFTDPARSADISANTNVRRRTSFVFMADVGTAVSN
ncbi:hypothetical protein OUZ56_008552 [Daphnia magna]|uniref:Receptor ligand binding region domain-containing protein n=1 Tax=Daphnia magna TaxID=35525 RepID=A0ABR0ADC0_9CRUS|nr:hypothetical protein OUZ56_008552 [Daphnia magna]